MEFNVKKYKVMEVGKGARRPTWNYKLGNNAIGKVNEEKDVGMVIQDNISTEKYIKKTRVETCKLVTNMRVASHHMDEEMMRIQITCMIRPRLEYAEVVWSPHTKKHKGKIERIKETVTKTLMSLSYQES